MQTFSPLRDIWFNGITIDFSFKIEWVRAIWIFLRSQFFLTHPVVFSSHKQLDLCRMQQHCSTHCSTALQNPGLQTGTFTVFSWVWPWLAHCGSLQGWLEILDSTSAVSAAADNSAVRPFIELSSDPELNSKAKRPRKSRRKSRISDKTQQMFVTVPILTSSFLLVLGDGY